MTSIIYPHGQRWGRHRARGEGGGVHVSMGNAYCALLLCPSHTVEELTNEPIQ
jgi:hypothetical protein